MIRLLLIEDNASIVVAGLKHMFRPERDEIRVSIVAESVDEAMRIAGMDDFDLIILDLWLSLSLPMDNLRKLRTAFPGKPLMIYTQEDSTVWRNKMLKAGAGAYITKDSPREEVKNAIMKVAAGEVWITGSFDVTDWITVYGANRSMSGPLSPVQRRMAELLAHGADRREIANEMSIHPSAVDKTFAKLRLQFQCRNNYELVRILTDNMLI